MISWGFPWVSFLTKDAEGQWIGFFGVTSPETACLEVVPVKPITTFLDGPWGLEATNIYKMNKLLEKGIEKVIFSVESMVVCCW